jgi:molybdopterin/thiamine biosynthesis adenylyltransferase
MANRYRRLSHIEALGPSAWAVLSVRSAVVLGCGALGTAVASLLARSGVGRLRLLDRDVVEESNLPDQFLYTEADAREQRPKSEVAAARLREVNSEIRIEAVVADLAADNAEASVEGFDLIFDATDNLNTKYLINEAAIATCTPWVYAGCAGRRGSVLAIIPGQTACLRCIWPRVPPVVDSCESMGLVPATAFVVAGMQVMEGLKILLGQANELNQFVLTIDLWSGHFRKLPKPALPNLDDPCPACELRQFEHLGRQRSMEATVMCSGRTVLLSREYSAPFNYEVVASQITTRFPVKRGPGYFSFEMDGHKLFIYQSGRALVVGTGDAPRARALYESVLNDV